MRCRDRPMALLILCARCEADPRVLGKSWPRPSLPSAAGRGTAAWVARRIRADNNPAHVEIPDPGGHENIPPPARATDAPESRAHTVLRTDQTGRRIG